MKCAKCGTEFEGNFCPNGCNSNIQPPKAKKPLFTKWWFWAIIAVLAVVIIASAGGETDPGEPSGAAPGQITSAPTNTVPSQNTTTSPETTTGATETDNVYRPGSVIDANGLKITYVSAEEYTTNNMFLQPDEGYKYIRLKLSAENTSKSDKYISAFEFECYADGIKVESAWISDDSLSGGEISSGRKTEGYIYYTVPTDAAVIEVEYETSFWTDKKAILLVELGE